jgi:hypothetical protein
LEGLGLDIVEGRKGLGVVFGKNPAEDRIHMFVQLLTNIVAASGARGGSGHG